MASFIRILVDSKNRENIISGTDYRCGAKAIYCREKPRSSAATENNYWPRTQTARWRASYTPRGYFAHKRGSWLFYSRLVWRSGMRGGNSRSLSKISIFPLILRGKIGINEREGPDKSRMQEASLTGVPLFFRQPWFPGKRSPWMAQTGIGRK